MGGKAVASGSRVIPLDSKGRKTPFLTEFLNEKSEKANLVMQVELSAGEGVLSSEQDRQKGLKSDSCGWHCRQVL